MITRRKQDGIVYTPRWLVNLILDAVEFDGSQGRLLDPSCGEGAFLEAAAERIVAKSGKAELVGVDIDQKAADQCRKRLSNLGVPFKILCQDALYAKNLGSFDFVIGNPPYVRIQHLGKNRRERIQRSFRFCSKGSTDLFLAFFELGFSLLKSKGKLGYITPNTWLKTKTAFDWRKFLNHEKPVSKLIDFAHWQLFEEITTYSLVSILEKGVKHEKFSLYKGNAKGKITSLGKAQMKEMDPSNWILCSPKDRKRLAKLRDNRIPLSEVAKIHVGLTTLADQLFIFQKPNLENGVAAIIHPITRKPVFVEREILKPIVKASVLKSGKENQRRYIVFPYYGKTLIPESEMESKYPMAYQYLLSVKCELDKRDKGKPNPVGWYAFGRQQGLETSFGVKLLTSPINVKPNFILWDKPNYTFYSGYCVKSSKNLRQLQQQLNSQDMKFYINSISRDYQNGYKSFAKAFIAHFPVPTTI